MADNDYGDAPQQLTGTCVKWITDRGYGFIHPDDSSAGGDIFCHSSALIDQANRDCLNTGEKVTFELQEDDRSSKMRACNVRGDGSGDPPPPRRENNYGDDGGYRRGGYGDRRGRGGRRGGFSDRRGGGFGGRSQGGGVCFQFRDYGECRFGEGCRFSHDSN